IRVYNKEGKGGFTGAAPILGNETQAIALKGKWQFRTGDDPAWAKGGPTAADVTFLRVEDAATVTRRLFGDTGPKALSPAESLKHFTVESDLEIEQVLHEPTVRQPLSLSFDERGRMWVVQYLQYPNPAGLKMLSRDKYWRAV